MIRHLYEDFIRGKLPPKEHYPDLPDWFWPGSARKVCLNKCARRNYQGLDARAFSAAVAKPDGDTFTGVVFLGQRTCKSHIELHPAFLTKEQLNELLQLVAYADKSFMVGTSQRNTEALFTAQGLVFALYYIDPSDGNHPEAHFAVPHFPSHLDQKGVQDFMKFLKELKRDLDKCPPPKISECGKGEDGP